MSKKEYQRPPIVIAEEHERLIGLALSALDRGSRIGPDPDAFNGG